MACDKHGPACEPEWEEHWGSFKKVMEARFKTGHEEYGDNPGTFSRDSEELICELLEELEDVVGWGFALRVRLLHMLDKARACYPQQRANDLLKSCRGQNDKLIQENMRLREVEKAAVLAAEAIEERKFGGTGGYQYAEGIRAAVGNRDESETSED